MNAVVLPTNITTNLDAHGILVATIDMPQRAMNVFSVELTDSLEQLLDQVASSDAIRAVVLVSGKKSFLAGADLRMIRQFIDGAQSASDVALHALCGRLGRLFRRLETNGKPVVAAVHGLALGGGLELALACHHRILSNSAATNIGLPEIKLGLLPGAGGTQRLPRLLGPKAAFAMLLGGEAITAQEALECGLADELVDEDALLSAAIHRAGESASSKALAPWDREGWQPPASEYDFAASSCLNEILLDAGIGDEQRARYPAYEAIVQAVATAWPMSMDEAIDCEMSGFVRLIRNSVAGNMVRTLFLNRQRAGKLLGPDPATPRPRRIYFDGRMPESLIEAFNQANVSIEPAHPPVDDGLDYGLVVTQRLGQHVRQATIAWLRDTPASIADFGAQCGIFVADRTSLGRTVEFCTADGSVPEPHLDIARWLKATALITRRTCLLQKLTATAQATAGLDVDERLLACALEAARVWRSGAVDDLELADVALVVAGFAPPHTGGLFTYLRQTGLPEIGARAARATALHGRFFDIPDDCARLFEE